MVARAVHRSVHHLQYSFKCLVDVEKKKKMSRKSAQLAIYFMLSAKVVGVNTNRTPEPSMTAVAPRAWSFRLSRTFLSPSPPRYPKACLKKKCLPCSSFEYIFVLPWNLTGRPAKRLQIPLPHLAFIHVTPPTPHPRNHTTMKDSKGWDGKLRVEPKATITNPEALEDPDYSDEDAPPVEEINADEGGFTITARRFPWRRISCKQIPVLTHVSHPRSVRRWG